MTIAKATIHGQRLSGTLCPNKVFHAQMNTKGPTNTPTTTMMRTHDSSLNPPYGPLNLSHTFSFTSSLMHRAFGASTAPLLGAPGSAGDGTT